MSVGPSVGTAPHRLEDARWQTSVVVSWPMQIDSERPATAESFRAHCSISGQFQRKLERLASGLVPRGWTRRWNNHAPMNSTRLLHEDVPDRSSTAGLRACAGGASITPSCRLDKSFTEDPMNATKDVPDREVEHPVRTTGSKASVECAPAPGDAQTVTEIELKDEATVDATPLAVVTLNLEKECPGSWRFEAPDGSGSSVPVQYVYLRKEFLPDGQPPPAITITIVAADPISAPPTRRAVRARAHAERLAQLTSMAEQQESHPALVRYRAMFPEIFDK